MSFSSWITELYEKLEGRHIFRYYNLFKKNEYDSFAVLRDNQFQRLKRLVFPVYKTVPYCRDAFDRRKFKPEQLNIPHDITKREQS